MSTNLNLAPGLHEGVSEADYHSDNLCDEVTLSRSLAATLCNEAPIRGYYEHPRLGAAEKAKAEGDDGEEPTDKMDFGSLGHALLLGRGQEIVIGEWKNWQKNEAKDFRKAVRADGKLPVLRKTYDRGVALCNGAMKQFHDLGRLSAFKAAQPEVVCIHRDGTTLCRTMYDRLLIEHGRVRIFDIKITESAKPETCERQITNMLYDLQEAWYKTAIERAMPEYAGRVEFEFLFIEDSFPFLVTPVQLNGEFHMLGISKYSHALSVWEKCRRLNQWPGYADGTHAHKAAPKEWALAVEMGRKFPTFKEDAAAASQARHDNH